MSPQVARNRAAQYLMDEMAAHCTGLNRQWLRSQVNAIVLEELRQIRADILRDVQATRHYHAGDSGVPEDAVLTARKVIARIDRRIAGEHI